MLLVPRRVFGLVPWSCDPDFPTCRRRGASAHFGRAGVSSPRASTTKRPARTPKP